MDEGITKRLSFGEVSQHLNATQQLAVEDVIKALKMPSVENFNTALSLLEDGCQKRFNVIEDTAKEQSAAVGEADLRRMKRQFSSLKNTFLHYVVKDEFIAALADGLPNGTENVLLAQYDEEANRNIDNLRKMKARNSETQEEISGFISQINQVLSDISNSNNKATSIMTQVQREIQEAHASAAEIPQLPDGLDEDQCQAALAEEAARARTLEEQIVQQSSKASELETFLPSEREETEVLQALAADLSTQRSAYGNVVEGAEATMIISQNARFAGTAAWAEHVAALLQALGGVKIVSSGHTQPSSSMVSSMASTVLELELSTSFPCSAVSNGSLTACTSGTHMLSLVLDSLTGSIQSATLTPADIDTSDIVQAAVSKSHSTEFVLREVRSRLAGILHRRALAMEASTLFPGTMVDPSGVSITSPVPVVLGTSSSFLNVHVVMDSSWPSGDDNARIVSVSGDGVDAEKVDVLNGRVFEGKGFLAALEAVQQAYLD